MPVTKDAPAPYAPTAVVLSLIERYRQKGLPTPITQETLARAGVGDSLTSRTLYALKVLDLIDAEGRPTPVLEGLRLAKETEYAARMAEWLRCAYADALEYVDPATSGPADVRDAFRSYTPIGQQDRMVNLFLGLFQAAGVMPEGKKVQARSAPKSGESNRRTKSGGGADISSMAQAPSPKPVFHAIPPSAPNGEKALEYRLVDLMADAIGEPEVLQAIIKVVTFLKARDAGHKTTATDQ